MTIEHLGTYDYAGFTYRVTRIPSEKNTGERPLYTYILQPEKGQHRAAGKNKHLRAALSCYLQDRQKVRL